MSTYGVSSPNRHPGPSPSSAGGGHRPFAMSPNKIGNPTTPNRIGVRVLKTPPTSTGLTMLTGEVNNPRGAGRWSYGAISSVDDRTPDTTPVPMENDSVIRPGDISDIPPKSGMVHPHHSRSSLTPSISSPEYSDDDFESSSDEADTPEKGSQQPVHGSGRKLSAVDTTSVIAAVAGDSGGSDAPHRDQNKSPSPPPGEPNSSARNSRRGSRRFSQDSALAAAAAAGGGGGAGAPPPTRAHIQEVDSGASPPEKPKKPPTLQVNMGQKQLIGKGSFGDVYKAVDMLTNRFVAVKEIVLVEDDTKDLKKQIHAVEREMRVMQKLDHPNIVKYLGAKRKGSTLYLYTEFIPGGTITDFVRSYGPCNELQAARFLKQIMLGLHYLHGKHMVHRDLKGDNLFIDANGGLKLGDFGTSKELTTLRITNSVAGTPYFMAPEVINCSGHGLAADIWSVGCCLIQLLTGQPPFHECDNAFAIMFQVSKGEIESQIPTKVSDGARDFMHNCLGMNPKERWTTEQLLAHPWLTTTLNESRPKSATVVPPVEQRGESGRPSAPSSSHQQEPPATAATPGVLAVSSPDGPNSGTVDRLRTRIASAGSTPPPTASTPSTKPPRNTSAGKSPSVGGAGSKKSPPPPEVSNYQGRGTPSHERRTTTKPSSSNSTGSGGKRSGVSSSSSNGAAVGTPLKRTPSTGGRNTMSGGGSKRPCAPK